MEVKRSKFSQVTSLRLICCLGLSLLLISSQLNQIQARYLPTRADESDLEVLKNLVKGLMYENQNEILMRYMDRMEARLRNVQCQRQQQQQQQQIPIQLQKRSGEIPLINTGGDSDIRGIQ